MADLQVFVDGADRSHLVDRSGQRVSYDRDIQGQGSASFTLADVPSGFVPDDGMEVLIKEDGTDRFGGIIDTRPRAFRGPDHADQLTFYSISVASWEQRLNKRRVWRAYNDTFANIVADLNTNFLDSEGFTLAVLAGGTHEITFNGATVAEALDELCALETDGRVWYITPAKVITIDVHTATAAPATLDRTNLELNSPAPSIEPDRSGYANRVTVVGGNPDLPITYTASDAAEITARAAAEGGSGIYHATVEDNEVKTKLQAQERAEGILLLRKRIRNRFQGLTDVAGFELGQKVNIDLPNLGIAVASDFFITGIRSEFSPGANELHHTITAVDDLLDGSWQSEYRRKIQPRTIPMQIEPTPGLVRVEPQAGVLIHDPERDPTEWFQGTLSGALSQTPTGVGISADGRWMLSIRRGGAANTGGCSGGEFPGCGGCHASRQSVFEAYRIEDNQAATSPARCASWAELLATAGFKDAVVSSPDSRFAAFVHYGSPGKFGVVDVLNGELLGSADTNMSAQGNGGEPVWVGDYVYWPDVSTGDIYIFNVTDREAPTEAAVFSTSLTAVFSVIVGDSSGVLLAAGTGGMVGLDRSAPTALVEDDTALANDYVSIAIDERGVVAAASRADASNVDVALVSTVGTALTVDFEGNVALATGTMEGYGCIHSLGSFAVYSERNVTGANDLDLHVFDTRDTSAPAFIETIAYTHAATGNLGPARTTEVEKSVYVFNFNGDSQVTYGLEAFDKIEPYEIERPLRTAFGGTGLGDGDYQKGVLLAGIDHDRLGTIEATPDGSFFRTRVDETTGLKWERDLLLNQVAITDADSPYTVPDGVTVVLADATSGAITVVLPAVANHFERLVVVKNDGDGSNGVTIDPNGVETIDGDTTRVLTEAGQVLGVVGNAALEWEIVIGAPAAAFTQRGYIDGLITSNAADADHDISIGPGVCADVLAGNDAMVLSPAAITKQIDAAWAEGDDAGGLFSGTVAADTEYHVILITKDTDGTVDAGFDTMANGSNAPTGWTAVRRLGSVFTDASSNIRAYVQLGDLFNYDAAVLDLNDATGTAGTYETATLSVPANAWVYVRAVARATASTAIGLRLRRPGASTDFAIGAYLDNAGTATRQYNAPIWVQVDSAAQVEYSLGGDGTWDSARIDTLGWYDERGKNDQPTDEEVAMIRIDANELIDNGSGVIRQIAHASMNLDACGFRFGSVQDRTYLYAKLPESFVGVECHLVGVFAHATAGLTGSGDDMLKLEIGYALYDNNENLPNLGTVNDGTAANEVDIDHEFPFTQYETEALQLAVFTPSSTQRLFVARITRDGTEETGDGNRLAANLGCLHCYIIPTADDVGGFVVPDTVV